jgi:molecular chaperone DnaJ
MPRDYYEILGVSRTASADEIKRAYRKLAREHHPDVNHGRRDEAEEQFKEIGEAYGVLSDDDKRARYDQFGHAGVGGPADAGNYGGGLGDLFDVFFQGAQQAAGSRARDAVQRGSDLRTGLRLTLEEVYSGVTRELDLPMMRACATCEGSGAQPGTKVNTCTLCNGSGRVREVRQTFFGQFMQETPCARCGGKGKIPEQACTTCQGEGRVRGRRKVEVEVPPGVDDGDRLRVTGAGEDGEAGAPPGDLYCVIQVEENRHFLRDDFDVLHPLNITFPQAALGDTVEAPTLERDENGEPVMAEVTIAAGTQNGTRIRIPGKGFPNRFGARGDQICIARVTVPTHLDERRKELLREFAELSGEDPEEHPRGFFDRLKDAFRVD